MNVLFLTSSQIYDLNDHDIYQDLMRCFRSHGHNVYIVTPCERRNAQSTALYESLGCSILRVRTGNQSNCGIIEKGISTVSIQFEYIRAIKRFLGKIRFDLILYATPPVTLVSVVKRLKRRYNCKTYLMLKDIFPQGAVDLGVMSASGMIYRYFRRQESKLYEVSDHIGCMSEACAEYLSSHNSIDTDKIHICPNGLEYRSLSPLTDGEITEVRNKYSIPLDKKVLIYGGNLGKPQGIPFFMECCDLSRKYDQIHYVIVGKGTEYDYVKKFISERALDNVTLIDHLQREEYFRVVASSDIGIICLNERFTVPNVPSRILSYMENKIPVACMIDHATDIGRTAVDNGFGWTSYSGDMDSFFKMLDDILASDIKQMGIKGSEYMRKHYTAEAAYNAVCDHTAG